MLEVTRWWVDVSLTRHGAGLGDDIALGGYCPPAFDPDKTFSAPLPACDGVIHHLLVPS